MPNKIDQVQGVTLFGLVVAVVLAVLILIKVDKNHCDSKQYYMSLKQNNPRVIKRDMYGIPACQKNYINKGKSLPVDCALQLSQIEDGLQGDALFGDETGIQDDLMQDAWCCCDSTVKPNVYLDPSIRSCQ